MFRVKFNEDHTDGYRPARAVDKVAEQLAQLLKRQRMVLSHTDDQGFACYVLAGERPKVRRQRKACPNCGYKAA